MYVFLLNLCLYYPVSFFLVGDPLGVRSCINYGDSFLQVSRLFNFIFHFNLRRGYVFSILPSLTDLESNRTVNLS